MADGQLTDQFVTLTTTGPPANRVDGYAQAIGDGTSLATAKADVLKLLPSDVTTTSFRVSHDGNGSCGLWNLKSRTLGRWFGGKKVGDPQGTLGIVLDTTSAGGTLEFKSNDVSDASVGLASYSQSSSC